MRWESTPASSRTSPLWRTIAWQNGHPWPVATAPGQVMADLGVTIQSTKIAFDSRGMITYREGMGQGNDEEWRQVFTELAEVR